MGKTKMNKCIFPPHTKACISTALYELTFTKDIYISVIRDRVSAISIATGDHIYLPKLDKSHIYMVTLEVVTEKVSSAVDSVGLRSIIIGSRFHVYVVDKKDFHIE